MYLAIAEGGNGHGPVFNITYFESTKDVIEFKLKKVYNINTKQAEEYLKFPLTDKEIPRTKNIVKIINGDVSRWGDKNGYDVWSIWYKPDSKAISNTFQRIDFLTEIPSHG